MVGIVSVRVLLAGKWQEKVASWPGYCVFAVWFMVNKNMLHDATQDPYHCFLILAPYQLWKSALVKRGMYLGSNTQSESLTGKKRRWIRSISHLIRDVAASVNILISNWTIRFEKHCIALYGAVQTGLLRIIDYQRNACHSRWLLWRCNDCTKSETACTGFPRALSSLSKRDNSRVLNELLHPLRLLRDISPSLFACFSQTVLTCRVFLNSLLWDGEPAF